MTPTPNLNDPKHIAESGERIYKDRYKPTYEAEHPGEFVAINVLDGTATLGKTGSEALLRAKTQQPNGLFHLIRIGFPGAFEVGTAYRHVGPGRISR
jgi:hypothetical protein